MIDQVQQQDEISQAVSTKLTDAIVSVSISSDKLQAFLTLTPAEDGQPVTVEMISQAIAQAGIVDSLIDRRMVADCVQSQSATNVCIAQARMPEDGKDVEFFPLVESEVTAQPVVDEHGVADMGSTHQFLVVDINTPLMKRVPATAGIPGMDVTGETIKPKAGKDAEFAKKLTGVIISPENPHLLLAETKGHPVFVKHGVNVDPALHVENVDVHTGNITFDGSLEVKGDVASGMTIAVTGDVCVRGAVERAHIKAGKSIRVSGGILGEDGAVTMDGETVEYCIEAGEDIEASFVNASTMNAHNNIVVKEYIINSVVKAGNQVLLEHPSGKGALFGGTCEVGKQAVIKQLGNESYVPTRLVVGQLSKLYMVYQKLKKELETRLSEIAQLQTILKKVEQSKATVLGKTPVDKATKIENTITAINEKIARLRQQLSALEPEIEQQKKASIKVSRTIYPNVVMTINTISKNISEKIAGCTWLQAGDELVEQKRG